MDRESSKQTIRAGLIAGAFASGVFALTFLAAMLYIAS